MKMDITGVTILKGETEREQSFMPITTKRVPVPKVSLTEAQKRAINQDIYLNCMYLKKNLVR